MWGTVLVEVSFNSPILTYVTDKMDAILHKLRTCRLSLIACRSCFFCDSEILRL